MDSFVKKITSINDIKILVLLKKDIQNRIIEPIYWTERIDLYGKVNLINKRIQKLQDGE